MTRWWDFRDSCPKISPSSHIRSYPLPIPPDNTGGALSGTQLNLYIFCHIKHHKVKQLQELDLNQGPVTLKSRILTIIPFLYYLYRLRHPRLLSPYPSLHPLCSISCFLYFMFDICCCFGLLLNSWQTPIYPLKISVNLSLNLSESSVFFWFVYILLPEYSPHQIIINSSFDCLIHTYNHWVWNRVWTPS